MTAKKITRKDIAKMSFGDFLREARGPYGRLFSYLRPYRRRFVIGLICGALFGVSNGLLVATIKLATDIVLPSTGTSHAAAGAIIERMPGFIQNALTTLQHWAAANADGRSNAGMVVLACLAVPLVMALRGVFSYLNAYYVLWVSQRVLDDIRQQVYRHTLGQSLEFFNKQKAGDLVQTVYNQTRIAQQALTSVASDIVKEPISILSAVGMMLYYDWKFTLCALVLFPLCLLPVLLVSKKVRRTAAQEEEQAGQMMVHMQEAFAGIRVVKTHAREDYEADRFRAANQAMLRFVMKWRKAMELAGPAVEVVGSMGISAALAYAWWKPLTVSELLALQGSLVMLYPAFKALSRVQLMMQKCLASTSKVFELLDRPPGIADLPDARPLPARVTGEIRFDNVTYTYPGREKPAVLGLTLHIPAGTTCALVGESGSGKTTVLALLQRLYEPQTGTVTLDAHDVRGVTQASLRPQIATVSQDVFLFHDTIRANIRYGRLEATDPEIETAARQAYAHDFILQQPQGYETIIGDKGCNLSGGQQQRVSIARALLKNAPILLLDEATAALDSESEKRVQEAIATLAQGRTVVAIAHRLSTVLDADQIVVMEHGEIRAIGRHADLYEKSSLYRRLCDLQFKPGAEANGE